MWFVAGAMSKSAEISEMQVHPLSLNILFGFKRCRRHSVGLWWSWKSRVWGEPLKSRSRILAPNWHEITGVDCTSAGQWLCRSVLYTTTVQWLCGGELYDTALWYHGNNICITRCNSQPIMFFDWWQHTVHPRWNGAPGAHNHTPGKFDTFWLAILPAHDAIKTI